MKEENENFKIDLQNINPFGNIYVNYFVTIRKLNSFINIFYNINGINIYILKIFSIILSKI